MKNKIDKRKPDVGKILEEIKKGNQEITKEQNVTILIGTTGAGKSTLTNLLIGEELKSEKERGRDPCIRTSKKTKIEIANKLNSQTTLPNKGVDEQGNIYWDCPGYGDVRGVDRELTNAFYIKQILDRSNNVKIVLVVTYNSLTEGNSGQFTGLINRLIATFGEEISQEDISLIITKVNYKKTSEDIKEKLRIILEDQSENKDEGLSLAQKNVLSNLIDKTNIALFHKPNKEGKIFPSNKEQIQEVLEQANPIEIKQAKLSLSSDAKRLLDKIYKLTNDSITGEVEKLNQIIVESCKKKIEFITDHKKLKKYLNDLIDKIQLVKNADSLNQEFESLANEFLRDSVDDKHFDFVEGINYRNQQTSTKGQLGHLLNNNFLTDDRDLTSNADNLHYWYSVIDGVRILLAQRQIHLEYSTESAINPGEEYVPLRESTNRILLTDPYYINNFANYLKDDLDRITATGDHTDKTPWQEMPVSIIIPLLSNLHWRSIKIDINYQDKNCSILLNDPYGKNSFPNELQEIVLSEIYQAVEKLIQIEFKDNSFTLIKENVAVSESIIDQQGKGANRWDCGPITFENINDYLKHIKKGKVDELEYIIKNCNNLNHSQQIAHIRLEHAELIKQITSSELNTDRIEKINKQIATTRTHNLELAKQVEKLDQKTIENISNLEPLYISMIFEVIENNRVAKGKQYNLISNIEYSAEELNFACQAVLHEITSQYPKTKEESSQNTNKQNIANLSENFLANIKQSVDILDFLHNESKKNSFYKEYDMWIKSLVITEKQLSNLLIEPVIEQENVNLVIKGNLVNANILNKQKITDNTENIIIFSTSVMYVTDDLNYQGKNMYIIAPIWNISTNTKINLSGIQGKKIKEKAIDGHSFGEKGGDGVPGNPGGNGGSLFGIGCIFNNLSNLTINVSGGKGGRGQDGGRGAQGRDGKNGDVSLVASKDDSVLVSRKEVTLKDQKGGYNKATHIMKKTLTYNTQYEEIYESRGKQGESGGEGGKGGGGGSGGLPGEIYIWGLNGTELNYSSKKFYGHDGDNGTSGFAGKDGNNGNYFRGKHLNEVVFASIKRVKEKLVEDIELDTLDYKPPQKTSNNPTNTYTFIQDLVSSEADDGYTSESSSSTADAPLLQVPLDHNNENSSENKKSLGETVFKIGFFSSVAGGGGAAAVLEIGRRAGIHIIDEAIKVGIPHLAHLSTGAKAVAGATGGVTTSFLYAGGTVAGSYAFSSRNTRWLEKFKEYESEQEASYAPTTYGINHEGKKMPALTQFINCSIWLSKQKLACKQYVDSIKSSDKNNPFFRCKELINLINYKETRKEEEFSECSNFNYLDEYEILTATNSLPDSCANYSISIMGDNNSI